MQDAGLQIAADCCTRRNLGPTDPGTPEGRKSRGDRVALPSKDSWYEPKEAQAGGRLPATTASRVSGHQQQTKRLHPGICSIHFGIPGRWNDRSVVHPESRCWIACRRRISARPRTNGTVSRLLESWLHDHESSANGAAYSWSFILAKSYRGYTSFARLKKNSSNAFAAWGRSGFVTRPKAICVKNGSAPGTGTNAKWFGKMRAQEDTR